MSWKGGGGQLPGSEGPEGGNVSFLPGTRGKPLDQSLLPPGTRPCPWPRPAWMFPDTCTNREDGWEGSQVGALTEGRAVGLGGRGGGGPGSGLPATQGPQAGQKVSTGGPGWASPNL